VQKIKSGKFMDSINRRSLLAGTFAAGAGAAALPLTEGRLEERRKLRVVVTGGHPGDPEYGCGGTIARYADLGHEVVLLYLNDGERPGRPPGGVHGTRIAEAARACGILGARPLYAGQVDGEAVVDAAHYAAFRTVLEAERPDSVFTHWPIDNHADHRAISLLVYDAWLKMGRRFALYYYEVSNGEDTVQFSPTHYVDIAAVEPRKRRACYAHASQAPDRFYALQERVTRLRGIERGVGHAEGYVRHVQSPDFSLPLVS
jgi:LmbE family N-acetylglucosaminyl deacetylase